MALLNCCNKLAFADWLNVLPLITDALAVLVFGGLAVIERQIGNYVSVTLQGTKFFIVAVEESACGSSNYADVSRAECAICDGTNNPGTTGQTAGSAACAFNLAGAGNLQSGVRVAYLIIKNVPDADAFQLALDVDGPSLVQNFSY